MGNILLVTPPFLQPNAPYPATAYLKSYLERHGHHAEQYDLSVALLNAIFSSEFLTKVFDLYPVAKADGLEIDEEMLPDIERIHALRAAYIDTIDAVMEFLRGKDSTLAHPICRGDFLPQAGRFDTLEDPEEEFGWMGIQDCAKHLSLDQRSSAP